MSHFLVRTIDTIKKSNVLKQTKKINTITQVIFVTQFKISFRPIWGNALNGFYRRRYALHGLSYHNTVRPYVCLSVRPSVTLVDCFHMVRPTIMISSPYGSPIILVSGDITCIPKFEGGHPERGRWIRVGWVRNGDFRPISRRISETVRDTTNVTIDH